MPLNRAWIENNIPHRGRMCLLDEVLEWDADRIVCRSATHREPDHPLRSGGRLGAACGIEYAAQAMAVHGALAGGAPADGARAAADSRAEVGFLASLRDVRMYVLRLDDIDGDLICAAARVAGDSLTALYDFSLRSAERELLSGRATVILDADKKLKI
jgi:predicted hotdog family 3-hydroxylacyl-ACP dehydratase